MPFELVTDEYLAKRKTAEDAFRDFAGFAGTLKRDIDVKKELIERRAEKHEDIGGHQSRYLLLT